MRFLLIILFIYAAFWITKRLFRYFLVKWLKSNIQQQHQPNAKPGMSEKLVQCSSCQTFIPELKAVVVGKTYYCSEQHAKL